MTEKQVADASWEQVAADETGTVYVDRFEEGLRFIIMRGPCSLCAYVGLPVAHPLAGMSYDDLPVNCHGGLTFSREGGVSNFPAGFWWYGWDYAHCDDRAFYDRSRLARGDEKEWGVREVESDSWGALYDFRKLVKLSEVISGKKP
jgi:hypothetical protein